MKRLFCLLLTAAMLLGVLAGCAQTPDDGTKSTADTPSGTTGGTQSQAPGQEDVPDLSGKTITILTQETWVSGLSLSDILPRFRQIEERTGCTIVWETAPGGDYDTVVQTRLTGGLDDAPDIVMMGASTATLAQYIDEGLVYDLTQAYDVAPHIRDFYEEYRTDLKGALTYHDGGIYNVVSNVWLHPEEQAEWVGYDGDNALFYRGDIAAELGFTTYPKTIDELHQLLLAVKQAYPDMTPLHMWNWQGWESVRIFTSAYGLHFNNEQSGGYFYPDENGKIQFEPTLPQTKEWLAEMNQWYKEGLIQVSASEEQKIGAVAQGKTFAGFYSGVSEKCEAILKQTEPDAYFLYMPFPEKEGYETTVMPRNSFDKFFVIIDNGDEDQCRAAAQLLDYAYFSDYGIFSELAGVEGEGWSFDEDGNFVPNMDYVEALALGDVVLQESGANTHYNGPSIYRLDSKIAWAEALRQARLDMGMNEILTAQQQDNWKEINEINSSHYCQAFPVLFMTEDDLDEYNALTMDLNTFVEEKLERYIIGTDNLDNFQTEFVDVLYNSMHLNEAIAIQQQYYDAFMENAGA